MNLNPSWILQISWSSKIPLLVGRNKRGEEVMMTVMMKDLRDRSREAGEEEEEEVAIFQDMEIETQRSPE